MEEIELITIKKYIDSCDIISFDVFDTLIYRNVLVPTNIFDNISEKHNLKFFKKIRILSEKISNKIKHGNANLNDIYNIIKFFYGKSAAKRLYKYEIEEEIKSSYFNQEFGCVLNYCKENNKRIILTSDMYLLKKDLINIIKKIPFNIEEKDINISCEFRHSKRQGQLYKDIASKYKVDYNKIFHIGDNKISDFDVPKSIGVNAFLYKGNKSKLEIFNSRATDSKYYQLLGFIEKYEPSDFDDYEKIGYEALGPLLVGFCYYIKISTKNDDIYFLSRDGLIIKKCFEKLFSNFKTKYIYGSRKALINPTYFLCNNVDELLHSCYIPYKLSGEKLLKIFNIADDSECRNIITKYNLLNNVFQFEDLCENGKYRNLILELFPLIQSKSKFVSSEAYKYLDKEIETNSFSLIDIGWNGNMQKALARYCTDKYNVCNIQGVYVGINPFTANTNIEYFGYIENDYEYKSIKSYISLFEFMFSNHDGSVAGYKNCCPCFEEPEYDKKDVEYNILDKLQSSALKFVDDLKINKDNYDFYLNKNACFENINFLGTNPTLKQVKLFENIRFKDSDVKKMISFNDRENFKSFIVNYKNSLWRVGFLKRTLKIDLNYYNVNQIIRKIFINSRNDY